MSDATRCGKCGWVYWTSSYENWGTCDKCGSNNDFSKEGAELVDSKYARTYMNDLGENKNE